MKFASTIIVTAFGCVAAPIKAETENTYFTSQLAADPTAVPSSAGSQSTGKASFVVNGDGTVTMDIFWEIVGDDGPIDKENALIGIHIHSGDANTNGPIVFGFCGQDPLPPFGGACSQGWSADSAQTSTQYTGMICDMAPPAPCYNNGTSTAAEAAKDLIGGDDMYVNIHTTKSLAANGDAGPLGLIRGQLVKGDKASVAEEGLSGDVETTTDEIPDEADVMDETPPAATETGDNSGITKYGSLVAAIVSVIGAFAM